MGTLWVSQNPLVLLAARKPLECAKTLDAVDALGGSSLYLQGCYINAVGEARQTTYDFCVTYIAWVKETLRPKEGSAKYICFTVLMMGSPPGESS